MAAKLQVVFEDVALYFTRKEWTLLEDGDKALYREQMLRNYQALVSLGHRGPTPDLICRIQRGEVELSVHDHEDSGESALSEGSFPGAMSEPDPSFFATYSRAANWTHEEMKDLLTIWGREENQQALRKSHRNKEVFQQIAVEMTACGHHRDWEQCRTKTKWMKSCYKKVRDKNRSCGGTRYTMSFYRELAHILKDDCGLHTSSTFGPRSLKRGREQKSPPVDQEGLGDLATDGAWWVPEDESMSQELLVSQVPDTEERDTGDTITEPQDVNNSGTPSRWQTALEMVSVPMPPLIPEDCSDTAEPETPFPTRVPRMPHARISMGASQPVPPTQLSTPKPPSPSGKRTVPNSQAMADAGTMLEPAPSLSTTSSRSANWTHEEMKDLLAIWGKEQNQQALRKTHQNKEVFQWIAAEMTACGHNRDWVQCRSKTKWMKSCYKKVRDKNRSCGGTRYTMSFYRELAHILKDDGGVQATNTFDASWARTGIEKRVLPQKQEQKDLGDPAAAGVWLEPEEESTSQGPPMKPDPDEEEENAAGSSADTFAKPQGVDDDAPESIPQIALEVVPTPEDSGKPGSPDTSFPSSVPRVLWAFSLTDTSQPTLPSQLHAPTLPGTCGEGGAPNPQVVTDTGMVSEPAPSPSTTYIRSYNWTQAERRDLLAIWGREENQQALRKSHRNKKVFQRIAAEMTARGHNRDWEQCRSKTKWMKSCYKKVQDKNRSCGGTGHTMPFYRQLARILKGDQSGNTFDPRCPRMGTEQPPAPKEQEAPRHPAAAGTPLKLEEDSVSQELLISQVIDTKQDGGNNSTDTVVEAQDVDDNSALSRSWTAPGMVPAPPLPSNLEDDSKSGDPKTPFPMSVPGVLCTPSSTDASQAVPLGWLPTLASPSPGSERIAPNSQATVDTGTMLELAPSPSTTYSRSANWTEAETKDLLAIWGKEENQQALRKSHRNKEVFQQIAAEMTTRGHNRDWQLCRSKIKWMQCCYKKVWDKNRSGSGTECTMPFYRELAHILKEDGVCYRNTFASRGVSLGAEQQAATEEEEGPKDSGAAKTWLKLEEESMPQELLVNQVQDAEEQDGAGISSDTIIEAQDVMDETAPSKSQLTSEIVSFSPLPSTPNDHGDTADLETPFPICAPKMLRSSSSRDTSQPMQTSQLPAPMPPSLSGKKTAPNSQTTTDTSSISEPAPSPSATYSRSANWTHEETKDLLAIWGKEENQQALCKSHRNKEVFQRIAAEMTVRGHHRDWEQCRTKTKWMQHCYKKVRDRNRSCGGTRYTMPFYKELARILKGVRSGKTFDPFWLRVGTALETAPEEHAGQEGLGEPAAARTWWELDEESMSQELFTNQVQETGEEEMEESSSDSTVKPPDEGDDAAPSQSQLTSEMVSSPTLPSTLDDPSEIADVEMSFPIHGPKMLHSPSSRDTLQPVLPSQLPVPTPPGLTSKRNTTSSQTTVDTGTQSEPASSPSTTYSRSANWTHEETRDLLAIWGKEENQQALRKSHRNKEVFQRIAAEMTAQGHHRDWEQCRTKTKWMQHCYKKVRDKNRSGGGPRYTMPFYRELVRILSGDRGVHSSNTFATRCVKMHKGLEAAPKEQDGFGDPAAASTWWEQEEESMSQELFSSHFLDSEEQDNSTDTVVETRDVDDDAALSRSSMASGMVPVPPLLSTPEDHSEAGDPGSPFSPSVTRLLWAPSPGTVQPVSPSQLCTPRVPSPLGLGGVSDPLASTDTGTMSEPAPSPSTTYSRSANWTHEETKDLLAIWGREENQQALRKSHRNKEVFQQIAAEMTARGHHRDWEQCRTKTKWMQHCYKKDCSGGATGHTMPFHRELADILSEDRGMHSSNTFATRCRKTGPVLEAAPEEQDGLGDPTAATAWWELEEESISQDLLLNQVQDAEEQSPGENSNDTLVEPQDLDDDTTPSKSQISPKMVPFPSRPSTPEDHSLVPNLETSFPTYVPKMLLSPSLMGTSQPMPPGQLPLPILPGPRGERTAPSSQATTDVGTVLEPAPSPSTIYSRSANWTQVETRDLLAIWGREENQQALRKSHRNKEVFQQIALEMTARGHHRDWEQCRTKTKWMQHCYKKVRDRNRSGGGSRYTMPFYRELARILSDSRAVHTSNNLDARWARTDAEQQTMPKSRRSRRASGTPLLPGHCRSRRRNRCSKPVRESGPRHFRPPH
ncbi:uncharacterized protein LOC102369102 [Alligator sinensis]|uniref:Uncharacterized protein LOC102369102 n=1 Tax=Alligator sinensis TaxID=38654 RepID=A0A3Q0FXW5_ALLSI|nr:uncharacterized protein LOC102369102 [Alligator sinensis]XP_025050608.1 uncharacterized protein LOC102369102 [Alligator sinensis]XP_025050609.1 uncharacterized protein LOC102369102 [Alligator sinensis]XP_025050610.1 uncharacterized protein LOC102369102 [Alligator sinensis]